MNTATKTKIYRILAIDLDFTFDQAMKICHFAEKIETEIKKGQWWSQNQTPHAYIVDTLGTQNQN